MTRKTTHDMDVLTDDLVEGGAEEHFALAAQGSMSWHAAPHQLREEFRGYVRRVVAAGQTAELAARSKREVLP